MEVLSRSPPGFGMSSRDSAPASSPGSEGDATGKRTLPSRPRGSNKKNIGFTFVDQSADLQSIADKRIVSSSQRHAIRSHVMKTVRHSENLIGKKRPTGRENSRRSGAKINPALPFIQCELSASLVSSPSPASAEYSPSHSPGFGLPRTLVTGIPPDPSPRLDPFYTLPGNDGPSYNLIESLVYYCFEVFLPMTFPLERSESEGSVRRQTIMRSKIANPGSFFGMMAVVAAHKAITSRRHYDLKPSPCDHGLLLFDDEYARMKDHAIRATRERTTERSVIDADSIEATFSLIGAATIIGNFEEARIYLQGMRMNLSPHNEALDPSIGATAFIPMSDTKAAVGMLSKPLFAIPWQTAPTPEEEQLLMRSAPKPNSPMRNMGSAFLSLNRQGGVQWELSTEIYHVLRIAIAVCWFSQFNAESPRSLSAGDHDIFRKKTIELEHGMLDYVFDKETKEPMAIAPLEHIIRLTTLAMVSSFLSQALPSAGLGRALTYHELHAYESFVQSISPNGVPTVSERRVLTWAMCQYIHGASGQPEETHFLNILSEQLTALQIETFEAFEALLFTFLYVPTVQRPAWTLIWNRAEVLWKREGSVTSWRSTVSPPPARASIQPP